MSQDRNSHQSGGDPEPGAHDGATGGDGDNGLYHEPVMVDVVVELMRPITRGIVVDATFGGGGHTKAMKQELGTDVTVVGIDRDPMARAQAPPGVEVLGGDFGDFRRVLEDAGIDRISAVLFDLGVSSRQLDDPARGFSYRSDGPLDMRMDTERGRTAAELIDEVSLDELTDLIRRYGEEPMARRIAHAIVAARPIATTARLTEVVLDAMPAFRRNRRGHPARKTFQALRITVNRELESVASGLDQAIDMLEPGGRCVVISYHSLEDRIVKRRFQAGMTECVCPPDLPVCVCGAEPELQALVKGSLEPDATEVSANPRSRSARLRAVAKTAGGPESGDQETES